MKNVLLHLNSSARMDACDISVWLQYPFLREIGFVLAKNHPKCS